MNTILWIGQGMLALIFLVSGVNKSIYSEKQLISKGQTGVVGKSAATIKFIGISELLGVIGIIVPWLTGIFRGLTPITAGCFAILMILAAPIHYRLKEPRNVATNIFILALSLFVGIGRLMELV